MGMNESASEYQPLMPNQLQQPSHPLSALTGISDSLPSGVLEVWCCQAKHTKLAALQNSLYVQFLFSSKSTYNEEHQKRLPHLLLQQQPVLLPQKWWYSYRCFSKYFACAKERQESRLPRRTVDGVDGADAAADVEGNLPESVGTPKCNPEGRNWRVCCPSILRFFSFGSMTLDRNVDGSMRTRGIAIARVVHMQ